MLGSVFLIVRGLSGKFLNTNEKSRRKSRDLLVICSSALFGVEPVVETRTRLGRDLVECRASVERLLETFSRGGVRA